MPETYLDDLDSVGSGVQKGVGGDKFEGWKVTFRIINL